MIAATPRAVPRRSGGGCDGTRSTRDEEGDGANAAGTAAIAGARRGCVPPGGIGDAGAGERGGGGTPGGSGDGRGDGSGGGPPPDRHLAAAAPGLRSAAPRRSWWSTMVRRPRSGADGKGPTDGAATHA